jgi:RNA polymerase sigma-70 factor (ECF subfamily)
MQRQREAAATGTHNDDQALLGRAAAGEIEALGALYDRYGRLVFGVALRITGDRGSAEEIAQDTFLRLWQHAARYQSERGSLVAWLLTIAQRRAIDEVRSRRGSARRRELPLPDAPMLDSRLDFSSLAHLRVDIQRALAELPEAQREAIELMFFGGLSSREIARRTGNPLGTISTRLRLGMERLRALLRGHERRENDG